MDTKVKEMSASKHKNEFKKALTIILSVICGLLFFYWGFQAVFYLLSTGFGVDADSTFFDFVLGILGIIASLLVFLGAVNTWRKNKSHLVFFGSGLFVLKNILEIVNQVVRLVVRNNSSGLKGTLSTHVLRSTAWDISVYLALIVFWSFILWYFWSKQKEE